MLMLKSPHILLKINSKKNKSMNTKVLFNIVTNFAVLN